MATYRLPTLQKTIIYLDQLVISNIAKVLNPDFPRRERLLNEQPFWLDLFKKLDRLLKLQLIVCPDSHSHQDESLLSGAPSFAVLQDVYSHLSNDCRFKSSLAILQSQVHCHFRSYLQGHPEVEPTIPVKQVVFGDLNEWQNLIRVTVPFRSDQSEISSLHSERGAQHGVILDAFKRWQHDNTSFDLIVKEEARALGQAIIRGFFLYLYKLRQYEMGLLVTDQSPLDLLPPPAVNIVNAMGRILQESGTADPAAHLRIASEYFQSLHTLRVPYIRLSAMLFASMAKRANKGKKTPPNKGTVTDVTTIASLLPYCQAMFLDKEMASYLREAQLKKEVQKFGTRIFSVRSKDDFLSFLDDMERKASKMHLALVEQVYGQSWPMPFTSLLERRKRIPSGGLLSNDRLR